LGVRAKSVQPSAVGHRVWLVARPSVEGVGWAACPNAIRVADERPWQGQPAGAGESSPYVPLSMADN
jgi:hypothetical protein